VPGSVAVAGEQPLAGAGKFDLTAECLDRDVGQWNLGNPGWGLGVVDERHLVGKVLLSFFDVNIARRCLLGQRDARRRPKQD
jgi:hypothetical protein